MDKNSEKKLKREIDYLKILLENQKFLLNHIKAKYFFIFIILLGIITIISNQNIIQIPNYQKVSGIVFLFILDIFLGVILSIFIRYRKERGLIVDHHTHKLNEIRKKYEELGTAWWNLDPLPKNRH